VRSLLCVPIKDEQGAIVGVALAINKRDWGTRPFTGGAAVEAGTTADAAAAPAAAAALAKKKKDAPNAHPAFFNAQDERTIEALAGRVAAALQTVAREAEALVEAKANKGAEEDGAGAALRDDIGWLRRESGAARAGGAAVRRGAWNRRDDERAVAMEKAASQSASLLLAAHVGDVATVRSLIIEGADVELTGRDGRTALHVAVENQNSDVARELLNLGASADALDWAGRSPVRIARDNADGELLELFALFR
jgi:hypothetical protein